MKICVVGIGYVGLSNAILMSQNYAVTLLDINESKVNKINSKQSPIIEKMISEYLVSKNLNLIATTDKKIAFKNKDYIVIAVPTNFSEKINGFDTSIIDLIIKDISLLNPSAVVIIKSTVPIGFTESISKKYQMSNLYFCPEFLREGQSLKDSLYPSRIVIGGSTPQAKQFTKILIECALKDDIEVFFTSNAEAESIKLFSNSYLAMRVSFFNELDTFALENNLNSRKIIDGVSSDSRIGKFYNNPSFGYGGYCLPKDTRQLLSNFNDIPQELISSIVESNETRINFLAKKIINLSPKKIGVYRLIMKEGSDNWRKSSLLHLVNKLIKTKIKIFLYEPLMSHEDIDSSVTLVKTIDCFDEEVELILTNRLDSKILKYENKIFSRDVFGDN